MKTLSLLATLAGVALAVCGGLLWLVAPTEELHDQSATFFYLGGFLTFVFGILYSLLANHRGDEAEEWKDGKVGVGTVRSFGRSGLYKGVRTYRLQMTVEGEDGTRFEGTLDAQVGRRNVDNIQPGARFPVIYQASKPTRLLVPHGPLLHRAAVFFDYVSQRDGLLSNLALQAKYWGLPCRALVTGMKPTGRREGSALEWSLQLAVFTPDGQQFPSAATVWLGHGQYRALQSASYLEGRYLRDDRREIAIMIPRSLR